MKQININIGFATIPPDELEPRRSCISAAGQCYIAQPFLIVSVPEEAL